ncbi:MAG: hypothetical protein R3A45_00795 [Bdellovibrionota bacterium]
MTLVSSLAGHFGGYDAYYAASKAAVLHLVNLLLESFPRYGLN